MRDRPPRWLAATVFASVVFASGLPAQAGLGHLEDASTAPRGVIRFRPIIVWSRYDSRFGANGAEPLGAPFTADSLGVNRIAALSEIETRVQTATVSPFTLSLGRARLNATAREEVIPFALEYGLTERFAVGIVVPIVRKRAAILFRLDTAGGYVANVGPNLHRTSGAAQQTNILVQSEFAGAATALESRIASCTADNTGAGCGTVLALGPQLLAESQSFAAVVAELYGSLTGTGMAFVPLTVSPAQAAIALRVGDFNSRYRTVLGETTDRLVAVPRGAGGPAGSAEFQEYLTSDLGRDSLTTREWVGIGDVEVGFKFRVLDRPRTVRRRTGLQVAIAGGARLPTGSRQSFSEVVDMRIGEGSVIVDTRAVLDARTGRFGLLATGAFAARVHDKDTTDLAARNSSWTEIQLAPRWHLSEPLSLHAAYSLRSTDKLGGDQLIGGGVTFSTRSAANDSKALPWEMRFTHLQAISGDAARPRVFRDQLELRLYYRLLRRQ